MAVVNSSATSTVTVVSTVHQTQTINNGPLLIFGLPPELIAVILFAVAGIGYAWFRFSARGRPVIVEWLFRNYSGKQFRAMEDLNGLWLYIMNATGKKAATLKKNGLPIEVELTNNKARAYTIQERHRNGGLDSATRQDLINKGFKIKDLPFKNEKVRKGYILTEPDPPKKTLAYIDYEAGGAKIFRKYTVVEGTGTTMTVLDMKAKIDGTKEMEPGDEASAGLVHEELAASKSFLQLLAEAMQGNIKTFLIPLLAGLGIGGMITALLFVLSGHLK